MLTEQIKSAMERAMPAFPRNADAGQGRFDAAQLQAFAFQAMENLIAQGLLIPTLTLTGYQLQHALELAWPDVDSDPQQGETVVTLQQLEPFEANDEDTGERVPMPAGLYLIYDDLPDEGIVAVRSEPEPDTADYGLAKQVYDSLGNEMFDQTVEKLVEGAMPNPEHKATVRQEGPAVVCDFADGSRLVFLNGFAHVHPIPALDLAAGTEVSEPVPA